MPGITNPAEVYFKDGLWGWVTNAWKQLVATADGALHIQFVGQEADVEVKQTTPADLTPGVCGWDGDSWQKLPMVWGYSAIWDENLGGAAEGASWNVGTSVIPADEIWMLQALSIKNATRATTPVFLYIIRDSSAVVTLTYVANLAIGIPLFITVDIALRSGDVVWVYMGGCVALDVIEGGVCGYKMKIAE